MSTVSIVRSTAVSLGLIVGLSLPSGIKIAEADDDRKATSKRTKRKSAKKSANDRRGEQLFREFNPSLVEIMTEGSGGSGYIISKDGYILTNGHVISMFDREDPMRVSKKITVRMHDEKIHKAREIGHSLDPDVALLKIDVDYELKPVTFADSKQVVTGQVSWAAGMPRGLKQTYTKGVISNTERTALGTFTKVIQTDAAINPGNSGGPLLNEAGQVIGMNTYGVGGNNLGFALPIDVVLVLEEHFRKFGRFKRSSPSFMITKELYDDLGQAIGIEKGVFVEYVEPDTDAHKAGFRAGDVIIAVNGKSVHASKRSELLDFNWSLTTMPNSTEVSFTVKRPVAGGSPQTKTLALRLVESDPLPRKDHQIGEIRELRYDHLGLGVHELNRTYRYQYRLGKHAGVHIVTSGRSSPAQKAGLGRGHIVKAIQGVEVPTQQAFAQELDKQLKAKAKYIEVLYYRRGEELETVLAPSYPLRGKRLALVALTDEIEYLDFFHRFTLELGITPIWTGTVKQTKAAVYDHAEQPFSVVLARAPSSLKVDEFDAILFLGDKDSKPYWNDPALTRLVENAYTSGKVVAGVGPAAMVLIHASGPIKDKKMTTTRELGDLASQKAQKFTGGAVEADAKVVTTTGIDRRVVRRFLMALKGEMTN